MNTLNSSRSIFKCFHQNRFQPVGTCSDQSASCEEKETVATATFSCYKKQKAAASIQATSAAVNHDVSKSKESFIYVKHSGVVFIKCHLLCQSEGLHCYQLALLVEMKSDWSVWDVTYREFVQSPHRQFFLFVFLDESSPCQTDINPTDLWSISTPKTTTTKYPTDFIFLLYSLLFTFL